MVLEVPFRDGSNFITAVHWLWDQSGGPGPLDRNYRSEEDFLDWVEKFDIDWGYTQCYENTGIRFIFYFTDEDLAIRFKLMGF